MYNKLFHKFSKFKVVTGVIFKSIYKGFYRHVQLKIFGKKILKFFYDYTS